MRKRYLIIFSLVLFFVVLEIGSQAYTLLPYDNFSGIYIDKTKWLEGESVIEIDVGSQKLRSKVASINPIAITIYPHVDVNGLNFVTPTYVNSFQADVTILESSIINSASATARLEGSFYNDGTSGGGIIGDIFAMVAIGRETNGGLVGEAIIGRLTNAEGTTWNVLWYQTFSVSVVIGIPYTLYLAYDSTANQFTFRVGGEEKIVGPDVIPARIAEAKAPKGGLTTVVYVENATSSGYVSATFDNVYKNGILYDDFSTTTIDPARWANYEFVREISGGKLRSKVRSSSASLSSFINEFDFVNPCSINGFQTKFTPVRYENLSSGTAWVDAIIAAQLYHDGTPGGGLTGDVVAKVSVGGPGKSPIAFWLVYRFDDETGWNLRDLAYGQFAAPISLGTTYTLFLGWDGRQITFKLNDEVATFIPTGAIGPPNRHWKGISTLVHNPNGNEATIEALFDDVMVSSVSCYLDTIQKIFIGYYQRPAAPAGLNYWSSRLSDSGGDLNEIIEAFANSAESQALYGPINSSNISSVVTSIYWALFNRPPAQAGLDYYVNGFNEGRFTAATIMLNVLDGAQNADLQSVNNKVMTSNLFTRTIDPDLDGMNFQATYSGDADAQQARNFLSTVTSNPATIPTQAQVTLFIKNNIADPGDPILNP